MTAATLMVAVTTPPMMLTAAPWPPLESPAPRWAPWRCFVDLALSPPPIPANFSHGEQGRCELNVLVSSGSQTSRSQRQGTKVPGM